MPQTIVRPGRLALCSAFIVLVGASAAQVTPRPNPALPNAPIPQASRVPEADAGDAIYAPYAVGQATPRLKLENYVVLTFGPRALVSPAFTAAIRMARPPKAFPRDWKDGGEAFGRNYGEAFASKVALQTARYGTAILLHEDFRYRPSATATGFGRLVHAIGYTFVDQSDSGHPRLALANFAGAAAGGFTAAAILPDGYNSTSNGAKDSALRFGGLVFSNVAREYAPSIAKGFHSLHLPFPRLPIPEWYTKGLSASGLRRFQPSLASPALSPKPDAAQPPPPAPRAPAPPPPPSV